MNPQTPIVAEVDPNQPVTVTLSALQFLLIATQLAQDAYQVGEQCASEPLCAFHESAASAISETAQTILRAVAEAGRPVPPDHTPN